MGVATAEFLYRDHSFIVKAMGPSVSVNWWLLHYIALISFLGPFNYPSAEGVWPKGSRTTPVHSAEDHATTSVSLAVVYDFEYVNGYPRYYNKYRSDSDENEVRGVFSSDSAGDGGGNKNPDGDKKLDRDLSRKSDVKSVTQLKYIGCYDTWENSTGHYFTNTYFDGPVSIKGCMDFCVLVDREARTEDIVSQIKEHFCICYYWENFVNVRVEDEHCQIECSDGVSGSTCGGNFALSAYCNPEHSKCEEFEKPSVEFSYEEDDSTKDGPNNSDSESEEDNTKLKVFQTCTNCSTCTGTYYPFFDYLPRNTPEACVQFCKRTIRYWALDEWRIRNPTPLAAVGWTKGKLKDLAFSSCACLMNEDNLTQYDAQSCNQKCPGDNDHICGGEDSYLFSVYRTGITVDPEPSSTEPTIVTAVPTTLFEGSGSDPAQGSSSSPSPSQPCSTMCSGKDIFGTSWSACSGSIASQECPKHARGKATWNCLANGDFEGVSPNYDNCVSLWVQKIEELVDQRPNMTYIDAAGFLDTLRRNCERAKNLWETDVQYFGHEIKQIFEIVDKVVKHPNLDQEIELPGFETLASETVHIGSSILTNLHTWNQLNTENRSVSATKLIHALEETMFELNTKATKLGETTYSNKFNAAEVLGLYTGVKPKASVGNQTFQYTVTNSYIKLPAGWVNALGTVDQEISYLGMNIDSEHVNQVFPNRISTTGSKSILPGSTKSLNGNLMSLSLTRPTANSSVQFPGEKGVEIKFYHDVHAWGSNGEVRNIRRKLHPGEKPKAVLGSAICVYWDTDIGEWSSAGCKLIKSEESASYCECTHLTAFAVLMSHHNYVGKDFGLEILTLILCPLSIICLFTTIVIFTLVRTTHGQRTTITKNLALCLLVGNTLVLLVTDKHYFNLSPAVCTGAAIFTHYVFLSAFMWMLIEGYHLYKMVVYVFDTGSSYMTIYRVLAYGLPLIIVGITGVVGYLSHADAYGGEDFCWLQGNYIWSFNVPVAIIVLINLCVLFITMRIAYRVQTSPAQLPIRPRSYRTWIKGCFSITILLGVTWIVGFFMMSDSTGSLVLAYLFTILNASQGILLCIFHCLFNEKVRLAAEKRNINLPIWFSTAGTGTNSSDPSNPSSQAQAQRAKANMRMYFPDMLRGKEMSASAFRESTVVRRNSNSKIKAKVMANKNDTTTSGTVSSMDSSRSSNSSGYNSKNGSTKTHDSESGAHNQRNFQN